MAGASGSGTRPPKKKLSVSSVYSLDSSSSEDFSRSSKAHPSLTRYLKEELREERLRNDALLSANASLKSRVEQLEDADRPSFTEHLKGEVREERRRSDALLYENASLTSRVEHLEETLMLLRTKNEALRKMIPNPPSVNDLMHPPAVPSEPEYSLVTPKIEM